MKAITITFIITVGILTTVDLVVFLSTWTPL